MTAGEVITLVDALEPNQYTEQNKLTWLDRLDGQIFNEVIYTHAHEEGAHYTPLSSGDDELIVAFLDMVENHKMIVENSGLLSVAAAKHLDEKNKRVQIDGDKLKFIATSGLLNVTYADFKRLTDSLENKETVKLTPENGVLEYTAEDPGINYEIQIPAKDIKKLKITSKDGKYLPLSNLRINIATEVDGANRLVISEGTIIDVRGLNLTLDSNDIVASFRFAIQFANFRLYIVNCCICRSLDYTDFRTFSRNQIIFVDI